MTTAEIINCAPWRGTSPRPLTQYEWTIVERAIHDGITTGKMYSAATRQLAVALTMAVSKQTACPSWTHSSFGPGPAVATYAYGCLGSWFGALDPGNQIKVLADVNNTTLLCAAQVPWTACPRAQHDLLYKPANHSEYSAQQGDIPPGVIPAGRCVLPRRLIAYTPLTGAQLVQMASQLNGNQLTPALQQIMQMGGQLFADRSFLVGWQVRSGSQLPGITSLVTPQDLLKLAQGMVEDIALIWAPGQGTSIRDMVMSGQLDPAALMMLLQQLAPLLIDDVFKDLPGLLPGLLQNVPPQVGTDLGAIIGGLLGQMSPGTPAQLAADPPTQAATGLHVVDAPATAQDPEPPAGMEADTAGEIPSWMWFSGAAIVGFAGTSYIRRLVS